MTGLRKGRSGPEQLGLGGQVIGLDSSTRFESQMLDAGDLLRLLGGGGESFLQGPGLLDDGQSLVDAALHLELDEAQSLGRPPLLRLRPPDHIRPAATCEDRIRKLEGGLPLPSEVALDRSVVGVASSQLEVRQPGGPGLAAPRLGGEHIPASRLQRRAPSLGSGQRLCAIRRPRQPQSER